MPEDSNDGGKASRTTAANETNKGRDAAAHAAAAAAIKRSQMGNTISGNDTRSRILAVAEDESATTVITDITHPGSHKAALVSPQLAASKSASTSRRTDSLTARKYFVSATVDDTRAIKPTSETPIILAGTKQELGTPIPPPMAENGFKSEDREEEEEIGVFMPQATIKKKRKYPETRDRKNGTVIIDLLSSDESESEVKKITEKKRIRMSPLRNTKISTTAERRLERIPILNMMETKKQIGGPGAGEPGPVSRHVPSLMPIPPSTTGTICNTAADAATATKEILLYPGSATGSKAHAFSPRLSPPPISPSLREGEPAKNQSKKWTEHLTRNTTTQHRPTAPPFRGGEADIEMMDNNYLCTRNIIKTAAAPRPINQHPGQKQQQDQPQRNQTGGGGGDINGACSNPFPPLPIPKTRHDCSRRTSSIPTTTTNPSPKITARNPSNNHNNDNNNNSVPNPAPRLPTAVTGHHAEEGYFFDEIIDVDSFDNEGCDESVSSSVKSVISPASNTKNPSSNTSSHIIGHVHQTGDTLSKPQQGNAKTNQCDDLSMPENELELYERLLAMQRLQLHGWQQQRERRQGSPPSALSGTGGIQGHKKLMDKGAEEVGSVSGHGRDIRVIENTLGKVHIQEPPPINVTSAAAAERYRRRYEREGVERSRALRGKALLLPKESGCKNHRNAAENDIDCEGGNNRSPLFTQPDNPQSSLSVSFLEEPQQFGGEEGEVRVAEEQKTPGEVSDTHRRAGEGGGLSSDKICKDGRYHRAGDEERDWDHGIPADLVEGSFLPPSPPPTTPSHQAAAAAADDDLDLVGQWNENADQEIGVEVPLMSPSRAEAPISTSTSPSSLRTTQTSTAATGAKTKAETKKTALNPPAIGDGAAATAGHEGEDEDELFGYDGGDDDSVEIARLLDFAQAQAQQEGKGVDHDGKQERGQSALLLGGVAQEEDRARGKRSSSSSLSSTTNPHNANDTLLLSLPPSSPSSSPSSSLSLSKKAQSSSSSAISMLTTDLSSIVTGPSIPTPLPALTTMPALAKAAAIVVNHQDKAVDPTLHPEPLLTSGERRGMPAMTTTAITPATRTDLTTEPSTAESVEDRVRKEGEMFDLVNGSKSLAKLIRANNRVNHKSPSRTASWREMAGHKEHNASTNGATAEGLDQWNGEKKKHVHTRNAGAAAQTASLGLEQRRKYFTVPASSSASLSGFGSQGKLNNGQESHSAQLEKSGVKDDRVLVSRRPSDRDGQEPTAEPLRAPPNLIGGLTQLAASARGDGGCRHGLSAGAEPEEKEVRDEEMIFFSSAGKKAISSSRPRTESKATAGGEDAEDYIDPLIKRHEFIKHKSRSLDALVECFAATAKLLCKTDVTEQIEEELMKVHEFSRIVLGKGYDKQLTKQELDGLLKKRVRVRQIRDNMNRRLERHLEKTGESPDTTKDRWTKTLDLVLGGQGMWDKLNRALEEAKSIETTMSMERREKGKHRHSGKGKGESALRERRTIMKDKDLHKDGEVINLDDWSTPKAPLKMKSVYDRKKEFEESQSAIMRRLTRTLAKFKHQAGERDEPESTYQESSSSSSSIATKHGRRSSVWGEQPTSDRNYEPSSSSEESEEEAGLEYSTAWAGSEDPVQGLDRHRPQPEKTLGHIASKEAGRGGIGQSGLQQSEGEEDGVDQDERREPPARRPTHGEKRLPQPARDTIPWTESPGQFEGASPANRVQGSQMNFYSVESQGEVEDVDAVATTSTTAEFLAEAHADDEDTNYYSGSRSRNGSRKSESDVVFEYVVKGEFWGIDGVPENETLILCEFFRRQQAEQKLMRTTKKVFAAFVAAAAASSSSIDGGDGGSGRFVDLNSKWEEGTLFSQTLDFTGDSGASGGCRIFIEQQIVPAHKYRKHLIINSNKESFFPRATYAVLWERKVSRGRDIGSSSSSSTNTNNNKEVDDLFFSDSESSSSFSAKEQVFCTAIDDLETYTVKEMANERAAQLLRSWWSSHLQGDKDRVYFGAAETDLWHYLAGLKEGQELFCREVSVTVSGLLGKKRVCREEGEGECGGEGEGQRETVPGEGGEREERMKVWVKEILSRGPNN